MVLKVYNISVSPTVSVKFFHSYPELITSVSKKILSFPRLGLSKQQLSFKQNGMLFQVCVNVHVVN